MIKFTAYNTSSPIPPLTSNFIPQHLDPPQAANMLPALSGRKLRSINIAMATSPFIPSGNLT